MLAFAQIPYLAMCHQPTPLKPVYTGKAMAGLMDLSARGFIAQGSCQLFLHTGGSQALPAYASVL